MCIARCRPLFSPILSATFANWFRPRTSARLAVRGLSAVRAVHLCRVLLLRRLPEPPGAGAGHLLLRRALRVPSEQGCEGFAGSSHKNFSVIWSRLSQQVKIYFHQKSPVIFFWEILFFSPKCKLQKTAKKIANCRKSTKCRFAGFLSAFAMISTLANLHLVGTLGLQKRVFASSKTQKLDTEENFIQIRMVFYLMGSFPSLHAGVGSTPPLSTERGPMVCTPPLSST